MIKLICKLIVISAFVLLIDSLNHRSNAQHLNHIDSLMNKPIYVKNIEEPEWNR